MASVLFVAGDPSGDAHAARLIDALRAKDPSLTFRGLGGPAMQRAGMTLLADLTAASAIGPFDAARHAGVFLRAKRLLEDELSARRPELVILVDFGDYNLPVVAPLVKRHHVPILYFISPQVWAWGRSRVRLIKRHVDRMVVFFPFEDALYREAGVPVTWVGHPLVDQAQPSCSREQAIERFGLNPWRRTVGLLPGSREREIARHLPVMLSAAGRIAHHMPGVQFLLLNAPGAPQAVVARAVAGAPCDVRVADGQAADALQLLDAAIVASGTATLETALHRVPMAVIYRGSWPTYLAARLVIRIPHIALVNVLAGKPIVPELIQHRATPARIAQTIIALLRDAPRAERMREEFQVVRARLGAPGAMDRAAGAVFDMLRAQ